MAFTFKNLLRHYAEWVNKWWMVNKWEIGLQTRNHEINTESVTYLILCCRWHNCRVHRNYHDTTLDTIIQPFWRRFSNPISHLLTNEMRSTHNEIPYFIGCIWSKRRMLQVTKLNNSAHWDYHQGNKMAALLQLSVEVELKGTSVLITYCLA